MVVNLVEMNRVQHTALVVAVFIGMFMPILISGNAVDAAQMTIQVDDVEHPSVNDSNGNNDSFMVSLGKQTDIFGYHPSTYDTAFLLINNTLHKRIYVLGQSDECYKCKLLQLTYLHRMSTELLSLDTRYGLKITIIENNTVYCTVPYHFGELGNYTLTVMPESGDTGGDVKCAISIEVEPRDSKMPMYIALAVYGACALMYCFVSLGLRKRWFHKILCCCRSNILNNNELGAANSSSHTVLISERIRINENQLPKNANRLKSLDTFRGLSLVAMIFGNYGGGKYWFFAHARWNGITPADLVFPWFVFIMGVSMTFSLRSLVNKKVSRPRLLIKIIRRTITLFALGCIVTSGDDLLNFRVTGVLQRFSISYLVVACLQLFSAKPGNYAPKMMSKYYAPFCDILDYWYEWIVIGCLMAVYSCITHLLPVPGCPTGYVGPGGPLVGNSKALLNCTGGAANYIDRWILGENHICPHSTTELVYHTRLHQDPEGILGSITSIFITFLGVQAGKILLLFERHDQRLRRLFIWGIMLGGVGTLLCCGSKENGWIPINKNLWSTSFSLVVSGTGFIVLAMFYCIIDLKKWWAGAPFYFTGMNSILLYCGHEVLQGHFPFTWQPMYHTHSEFLAMDLIGTTIWVIIAYAMFRMDFFVKI